MTDLEISKALAMAIGWKTHQMRPYGNVIEIQDVWSRRVFDYRDWNVIGPIAERYGMFPQRLGPKWNVRGWSATIAETPQKAIALAVIQAAK